MCVVSMFKLAQLGRLYTCSNLFILNCGQVAFDWNAFYDKFTLIDLNLIFVELKYDADNDTADKSLSRLHDNLKSTASEIDLL